MRDNIAAIATPFGEGALAVIRVSGDGAIALVNQVFKGKNLIKASSHTVNYGHIIYNGEIIDEVMATVYRAPRSYTAEDLVEITTHGGIYVTNKVLSSLLAIGFRLAEPGEFTKRAYLNGRIALSQAEAVMDVIASQNEQALRTSQNALRNSVLHLVNGLREQLLDMIGLIEVNIDYPEYDDAVITNVQIKEHLEKAIASIKEILVASNSYKLVQKGIDTAILGKPNVGKSSILNALLEENKAIVSKYAGTTRDIVEGYINIGNVTLHLLDTAGIRSTRSHVEKIGIQRSFEIARQAHLVLLVFDQGNITKEDYELLDITKDLERIIIINKNDLSKDDGLEYDGNVMRVSALSEIGLKELREEIVTRVNQLIGFSEKANYLTNIRQVDIMKLTLRFLEEALEAANENKPIDIIEIDIKQAWEGLGKIIGGSYSEELLDSIFQRFCLGK